LGFGPSAHSFDGNSRQWNISNNNTYIESINNSTVPFEKEELTPLQKLNEYIMTSLRTMEGISFETLATRFDIQQGDIIGKAKKFTEDDLIKIEAASMMLTQKGKLLADGIAAALFY